MRRSTIEALIAETEALLAHLGERSGPILRQRLDACRAALEPARAELDHERLCERRARTTESPYFGTVTLKKYQVSDV
jgi:hypothetical protein